MSSDDSANTKARGLWRIAFLLYSASTVLLAFGTFLFVFTKYPEARNFSFEEFLRMTPFCLLYVGITFALSPKLGKRASQIANRTKFPSHVYYGITLIPSLWFLSFFASILYITPGDWGAALAFSNRMSFEMACFFGIFLLLQEKAWPKTRKRN